MSLTFIPDFVQGSQATLPLLTGRTHGWRRGITQVQQVETSQPPRIYVLSPEKNFLRKASKAEAVLNQLKPTSYKLKHY